MNTRTSIICFCILLALLTIQCSKTKGKPENTDINEVCDDTAGVMSYTNHIVPILDASCGTSSSGCHNGGNYNGHLNDYAGVMEQVQSGALVHSVMRDQPGTYTPMPLGDNKLSDCKIYKIKK